MNDPIYFDLGQSLHADSGAWYRIVQVLGSGGNATTFLVLCTQGAYRGVLFALKVFRRLTEPERHQRFLDEIRVLQQIEHPAIMRVYDTGNYSKGFGDDKVEYPYVVAEYLPRRLYDVIRAGEASITEKISFSLQLLSALKHLSERDPQIVHRDIKPKNIFVKGGSCVLGDFGLMKLLDERAEVDRQIFKESVKPGMPFYYRTPDLIKYARNEEDLTVQSDVFQLGLVLAELFTGWNPAKRPRRRDPLEDLELEPLGRISGDLGASIIGILERMLVFEPTERYTVEKLLSPWQGIFEDAAKQAHSLEGRVL